MKIKTTTQAIKVSKQLKQWSYEYYFKNKSTVSDATYDQTLLALIDFEKDHPEFVNVDSPTQQVGAPISKKFTKFTHTTKMYSIANAFNFDDLLNFDKQIKKAIGNNDDLNYLMEFKIDGVSIALHYNRGKLLRGVTRGDGFEGEDITNNVKMVKSIPHKIDYLHPVEVRGEIFMSKSAFTTLKAKNKNFANPRNITSGTLRQLNSQIVKDRNLSSFMYMVTNLENHNLNSQLEVLNFLKKHHFVVNDHFSKTHNINQVIDRINYYEQKRFNLDYVVDGIVIKVNNVNLYNELGYTNKFPKYMIAYKFPAETGVTKILDIFPTIGRTGRVTYNAQLEKIELAGTFVEYATLHNATYIEKLNINIGDLVEVKKAGDIIPKVVKLIHKNNPSKWKSASFCPRCYKQLFIFEGEIDQYCNNPNCEAILENKLIHFASRGAMNIEGLGSELIKKLFKLKLLNSFESIFLLHNHQEELMKISGLGEKSVLNLLTAIESSKSQPFEKFLFSLGIRHIGEKNAKILVQHFQSLTNLTSATESELISIFEIGSIATRALLDYFCLIENHKMLINLKNLGLNMVATTNTKVSNNLNNLRFAITGKLTESRTYFKNLIETNGGIFTSVLSKKTNFLLAGKNSGSKINKAKLLNVKIITQEEFLIFLQKGINNGSY